MTTEQSEVEKTVRVDEVDFFCGECGCTSKVTEVHVLKAEVVERDRLNDVAIGNARIDCPVCGKSKYFWRK